MDPQILISGGGPIGNYLASQLKGYSTVVMEEHSEIGKPIQCTGLVHPRVTEIVKAQESILNTIKGLRLFFPDGRMIEVKTNEAKAVVIDRCMFDNICCEAAKEADATISTISKVLDFKRDGNELSVKCLIDGDKKEVRTKLLIGADGYKSQVGSYAGLGCSKRDSKRYPGRFRISNA